MYSKQTMMTNTLTNQPNKIISVNYEELKSGEYIKLLSQGFTGIIKYSNGGKHYFSNGLRHRTDGPAIEWHDGSEQWWLNDKIHRADGPAYSCWDGSKSYYKHGLRHRIGGPAVDNINGGKEWWIEGVKFNSPLLEVPINYVSTKKATAFVALTAWSKLYADYNDPNMTKEYKQAKYPLVLMVHRWDGRIGFPGGFSEPGETPEQTAIREFKEEIGELVDNHIEAGYITDPMQHLVSHEAPKIIEHLFHKPIKTLLVAKQLQWILSESIKGAEHSVVEGTPIWVHLADYGNGKGLTTLLRSNNLATGVKEELECLVSRLDTLKPI